MAQACSKSARGAPAYSTGPSGSQRGTTTDALRVSSEAALKLGSENEINLAYLGDVRVTRRR